MAVIDFSDFVRHRTLNVVLQGSPQGPVIEIQDSLQFTYQGRKFFVPAGFRCDGCSAPEFLNDRVQRINPYYLYAYIVHDYFYGSHGVDRKEADGILAWMLRELDAPKFKRFCVWAGVRVFGWTHWD